MKFKLIFISPNGTTKRTSEILKSVIEKSGHDVELLDIGNEKNRESVRFILEKLMDADIVGFGSPAYHMNMLEPMMRFFEEMLASKNSYHFKAFLYLNYAGITSGKAFLNAAKILKKMDIPIIGAMKVVAPHFHHKETFPTDNIEDFIKEFYYKIQAKKFDSILWENLFSMFSDQKVRVNLLYPLVHFLGKKRELGININCKKCVGCGRCAKECPVGAIGLSSFADIDFTKCIHCYHCTIACKLHAVEAPIEKLDDMIKMNKKVIGMERRQNYVYI